MEQELSYYRRRSAEESAAAAAATDKRVRQVHLDLAGRYGERVTLIEAREKQTHIRLVSAA